MTRKMQREVLTLDTASLKLIKLMMSGAVAMFVLVAAALFVLVTPAHAETPSASTATFTVWAVDLPHDFHTKASDANLNVVGIEDMFGTSIVLIQPTYGQDHAGVMQALNSEFPAFEFEVISDDKKNFVLIEN